MTTVWTLFIWMSLYNGMSGGAAVTTQKLEFTTEQQCNDAFTNVANINDGTVTLRSACFESLSQK